MVAALAPNGDKIGSANSSITPVKTTAITSMAVNELPKSCSARSFSLRPSKMEDRGAAPLLTSCAKEETSVMTGAQTPKAVRAKVPVSAICPTYMRSTTL